MKIAIMQPYFFPYLGYFQLLHAVDCFVVYDDVAFIKQGWVNRNRILINGQPSYVTVPLKQASSFRVIRDIEIDDSPQNRQWPARFLKSVDNAYRRAPQFERVFPLIESVFGAGATKVGELARASVRAVAAHLGLDTEWVETSTRYGNSELAGQERVLAICRAEHATEYVNAAGGAELYSREAFARAGITLRFLASSPHEYRQFGAPFVPWLSIIDVLMFNTPDEVGDRLEGFSASSCRHRAAKFTPVRRHSPVAAPAGTGLSSACGRAACWCRSSSATRSSSRSLPPGSPTRSTRLQSVDRLIWPSRRAPTSCCWR
jgi:hypothetical protein